MDGRCGRYTHDSALARKRIPAPATAWVNVCVTLSEVSLTQSHALYDSSYERRLERPDSSRWRSRVVARVGRAGDRGRCVTGTELQFHKMNCLEGMVVTAAQQGERTSCP